MDFPRLTTKKRRNIKRFKIHGFARLGTSSSFREIQEERNALEAIEELGRAGQLNQELKQSLWVIPQLSIPMVYEEIS